MRLGESTHPVDVFLTSILSLAKLFNQMKEQIISRKQQYPSLQARLKFVH